MTSVRPRLLVLTTTYPRWRGDPCPMFVADLSERLAGDFDVTVLAPGAKGAASRERVGNVEVRRYRYGWPAATQVLANGAIVPNLRRNPLLLAQAPPLVLAQLVAAWRLVRQERFDAIHAHWVLPQGWIAGLLRARYGIPVLTTSHGADLHALRSPLLRPLKRRSLHSSDALSAVSDELRNEMVALGIDRENVNVLPMGVDTSRFQPEAASPELRRELNPDGPSMLFVGRLAEKKGLRYAIEALPAITARHPAVRLFVIGDGPERANLEARAEQLGVLPHVHFAGAKPRDDLPGYFASADVFLAPFIIAGDGDREGSPVVIGEALASGCAVVASAVGAVPGLVRDGETGLLTPPGDAAAIARAVNRLLDDAPLRRRLSEAGTRHARDMLDERVIGGAYSRVLHEMIERAA